MNEQQWRDLISEEVASWLVTAYPRGDSDLVEFIRTGVTFPKVSK